MLPRKNSSSTTASPLLVFNQGKFQLFLQQMENFNWDCVFCEWIPPGESRAGPVGKLPPSQGGLIAQLTPVRKWIKLLRSRGLLKRQRLGLCRFPNKDNQQSKCCRNEVSVRKRSFEHVTQAQTHGSEADGKDWIECSMWWKPEVPPGLIFLVCLSCAGHRCWARVYNLHGQLLCASLCSKCFSQIDPSLCEVVRWYCYFVDDQTENRRVVIRPSSHD